MCYKKILRVMGFDNYLDFSFVSFIFIVNTLSYVVLMPSFSDMVT